ncbi:MAG: hypothetical protein NZM06_01295, partial [Chloroherpetonaceae bacterium]|nr:hypothetical protein [Chloroherpetonaceae bacterium]
MKKRKAALPLLLLVTLFCRPKPKNRQKDALFAIGTDFDGKFDEKKNQVIFALLRKPKNGFTEQKRKTSLFPFMTRTLLLALLLCLSNYGVSLAQGTFRWNSSTGNDWQIGANWFLESGTDDGENGYPDGSDEALFNGLSPTPGGPLTNIPAWDGNFTINGFTGTVQIGANFECNGTVTLTTGTLQVNSGANFLAGTLTINGGTLTLNSGSHELGDFTLSSGTFNGAGTIGFTKISVTGGTFNGGTGATYTRNYTVADADQSDTYTLISINGAGATFNAGTNTTYNLLVRARRTSGTSSYSVTATAIHLVSGTFSAGTSKFVFRANVDKNSTSGNVTATARIKGNLTFYNVEIGGTQE